ncbi:MAG: hypothetical protein DRI95_00965 [Bacteroidetes bacterium]|nr:MAG: hypothetical protein DRI95_00965 [Bacteroidota bacterium]
MKRIIFNVLGLLLVLYTLSFSACKPEDEANPEPADPSAEFSFVVDQLKSTFTATDISASSYIWTFGDDDTSYQQDPIHYFDIGGNYDVTLTVTNTVGDKFAITKTVTIPLQGGDGTDN